MVVNYLSIFLEFLVNGLVPVLGEMGLVIYI